MRTVVRSAGAIAAAIAVTLVLIVAVEWFGSIVHPIPEDFDGSSQQLAAHVESYPHWVLAVALAVYGIAGYAATWTAGRLGNPGSALVVGVLLLAAIVLNIAQLPYPLWFTVTSPVVLLLAIVAGYRRSTNRTTSTADPALQP